MKNYNDETVYTSTHQIIGTICGGCTLWKRDARHGAFGRFFQVGSFCTCSASTTIPRIPLSAACEALS